MIHVIAVITAHPGKRQDILDVLMPMVPGSLARKGCIEYTVTTDAEVVGPMHSQSKYGPDTFTIVEKWASLEHLKAHSVDPEATDYIKLVSPLMADRVTYFLSTVTEFHIDY